MKTRKNAEVLWIMFVGFKVYLAFSVVSSGFCFQLKKNRNSPVVHPGVPKPKTSSAAWIGALTVGKRRILLICEPALTLNDQPLSSPLIAYMLQSPNANRIKNVQSISCLSKRSEVSGAQIHEVPRWQNPNCCSFPAILCSLELQTPTLNFFCWNFPV